MDALTGRTTESLYKHDNITAHSAHLEILTKVILIGARRTETVLTTAHFPLPKAARLTTGRENSVATRDNRTRKRDPSWIAPNLATTFRYATGRQLQV
jgi:hypothetical protein